MRLIRYDSTGKIISVVTTNHEASFEANKIGLWIEDSADIHADYIEGGVVVHRPACPAVLAGTTLTSLPNPCVVVINSTKYDCADDHADLSFDQPGTYKIRVIAWPYLDGEFTYENPAQ